MNKQKIISLGILIFVYLFSTGASYLFFTGGAGAKKKIVSKPPKLSAKGMIEFDQSLPKTEECPLNGAKYSEQQKQWWDGHSPLGVMIENHEDSRPQSGLSFADVVYEAVAEGGITRFLAVFYCQDANPIGPVRSARTYFMDFVSEYGEYPLYAHVGGANTPGPANALGQIGDYGWNSYNDMNQFSIGYPTFWRDYDRLGPDTATEHTMYSSTTKLWDFAKKSRKITNKYEEGGSWKDTFVPYTFVDGAKKGTAQTIDVEIWEGYKQYAVTWNYDSATNSYLRTNGGSAHTDKNTGKQLTVKNIVVLSMVESNANDGYEDNAHLLYRTKGIGKATIFQNGEKIAGTWKKEGRKARTLLFDENGEPIAFVRGTIWFTVLPTDGVVNVR